MRVSVRLYSTITSAILLTACAAQPPAQVVDRGGMVFNRNALHTALASSNTDNAYTPYRLADINYARSEVRHSTAAAIEPMEVKELSPPASITSAQSSLHTPGAPLFSKNNYKPEAKAQLATIASHREAPANASNQPPPVMLQPLESLASLDKSGVQSVVLDVPITSNEASITQQSSMAVTHFIWPVEGRVISSFGPKKNGLVNDGINIKAVEGEPIWAAADGEVVYAGNELKGYGNMVIVKHNDNWMTAYAHAGDIRVKKGDTISQGDILGFVGKTGNVTEAQLHFGIRRGKTPVDPTTKLPQRLASN